MVTFLSRVLLAGLAVALVAGSTPRPNQPRGVRRQPAKLGSDHLLTGDGVRLPLAAWIPDGAPTAALLGLHGYGDYREAFGLAGRWLAAQGVAVYASDQRGFDPFRMLRLAPHRPAQAPIDKPGEWPRPSDRRSGRWTICSAAPSLQRSARGASLSSCGLRNPPWTDRPRRGRQRQCRWDHTLRMVA
jgi:hypothetical protein